MGIPPENIVEKPRIYARRAKMLSAVASQQKAIKRKQKDVSLAKSSNGKNLTT